MERTHAEIFPMIKPKVCILRADGINCDEELSYAFQKYGGDCEFIHVNELRDKSRKLKEFNILAIPGGFAYGDDIVSGKILATELVSFLRNQLEEFVTKGSQVIGICNGFQVLVRTGLLPFNHIGEMDVTLTNNDSGHFECRFVKVRIEDSRAVCLKPYVGQIVDIAVNHGEGKFYTDNNTLTLIENENLVFVRYVDDHGSPTQKYPENPNGALNAIAGVTDPTGHIIGLMPHPEKIVDLTQHPNWRRGNVKALGGFIFEGMIKFAKES